jgi:type IV fimbrial biogenesis protein FimT
MKSKGFTLIELMVTLAIAAIVITIGVPSFRQTINSNRLITVANSFIASINLARSEAIKRNSRVVVCGSSNGKECTGSGYQSGWIVFVDNNNDALCTNCGEDTGELVIQRVEALPGNMTLNAAGSMNSYISYSPSGSSKVTGGGFQFGTLKLCNADYKEQSRNIIIARGGRVRVEKKEPADCD